jgi:hypothetical protein
MFFRKGRTESDAGATRNRKARRLLNGAVVFLSVVVILVAIVEWQSPPPLPTVNYSPSPSTERPLPPISEDHWERVAASVTGTGISVEPYNVHAPNVMRVVVKNAPARFASTEEAERFGRQVRDQLGVAALVFVKDGTGVTLARISPWVIPARYSRQ